jgi:hypothetical protein
LDKDLDKVLSGLSDNNLRFNDLLRLLKRLSFIERVKGDHHVFHKEGITEILNLQPLGDGKAKAYQVKQIRDVILKYKLNREVEDV